MNEYEVLDSRYQKQCEIEMLGEHSKQIKAIIVHLSVVSILNAKIL